MHITIEPPLLVRSKSEWFRFPNFSWHPRTADRSRWTT